MAAADAKLCDLPMARLKARCNGLEDRTGWC